MGNNNDDPPYEMRLVVSEGRYTELQRKLIHGRARALLARLEIFKPSQPASGAPRYTEGEMRAIHERARTKLIRGIKVWLPSPTKFIKNIR
jgi:hypothetical protein